MDKLRSVYFEYSGEKKLYWNSIMVTSILPQKDVTDLTHLQGIKIYLSYILKIC